MTYMTFYLTNLHGAKSSPGTVDVVRTVVLTAVHVVVLTVAIVVVIHVVVVYVWDLFAGK